MLFTCIYIFFIYLSQWHYRLHTNCFTNKSFDTIYWSLFSFQFCKLYLVKFCPHDLFVNTRADLGACPKVHDDEAKDLFEKAPYSYRKQQYEDEFIRYCQSMLNEVERKIVKGKQRLALIGRTEAVSFFRRFGFRTRHNFCIANIQSWNMTLPCV